MKRCDRCAGIIYGKSYTTANGYTLHDDCAEGAWLNAPAPSTPEQPEGENRG